MVIIELTDEEYQLLQGCVWEAYEKMKGASEQAPNHEDEMVDYLGAQVFKGLYDRLWPDEPEGPMIGLA